MAVGRANPGGDAVGVLNLDAPPPEIAVQKVLEDPHIIGARVIELPPAGEMPAWLQL